MLIFLIVEYHKIKIVEDEQCWYFIILPNHQSLYYRSILSHACSLETNATWAFWRVITCIFTSAIMYPYVLLMLACYCDFCRTYFKIGKDAVKINWRILEDELDDLITVLYFVKFITWLLHNSLFIFLLYPQNTL